MTSTEIVDIVAKHLFVSRYQLCKHEKTCPHNITISRAILWKVLDNKNLSCEEILLAMGKKNPKNSYNSLYIYESYFNANFKSDSIFKARYEEIVTFIDKEEKRLLGVNGVQL